MKKINTIFLIIAVLIAGLGTLKAQTYQNVPLTTGSYKAAVVANVTDKHVVLGKRSVPGKKWLKGGFYAQFKPEQEILEKRTRVAKNFDNGDGTYSAILTGPTHYKDEGGAWQDIDFSIKGHL